MSDVANVVRAIKSASALTETTFLQIGQTLEVSMDILAGLAERFEVVLTELNGDNLNKALKALSRTIARIDEPGHTQSRGTATFVRLSALSDAIAHRIAQMTASLADVDILSINAKIAAANISVPGVDFSTFADEIGRTLKIARFSLAGFSDELRTVRRHVAAAHARQLVFERHQKETASSIKQRLTATVHAITLQNRRAARAAAGVKPGSVRIRQSIGDAVMALQIGDVTRQRLEHIDFALNMLVGETVPGGSPDSGEQRAFAIVNNRLQSAQCSDAARALDREVTTITKSLNSLAEEAHGLWVLGGSAYGASDRGGSTVILTLEDQVGEALALFERFEEARAEVARISATVSEAMDGLRVHLKKVQSLEGDIRIMGLNTTFKCARIGRDGLALNLIAQELRTYAYGFATEASELVREVETISTMTGWLTRADDPDGSTTIAEGMREIKDSAFTLRQVGQTLDDALTELEHGSRRVVALLGDTVTDLKVHDEIGRVLRHASEELNATLPDGPVPAADLTPSTERMLTLIERVYTMAGERAIHEEILGRPRFATAAATREVEDVLF